MKQQTRRGTSSSIIFFIFGTILFLVILTEITEAKRGCSAFGHACYGGHGKKRTDINFPLQSSAEEELSYINGSGEEVDPVLLSPSSTNHATNSMEEDDIASLNGYSPIVYQKYLRQINLSPFLRKWLQSYRRSQQEQHLLDEQQQQQLQLENQL